MTIPANFALHSGEKSAIIASFQKRRVSTSVVHRLPKPRRRVRLPYPAFFMHSNAKKYAARAGKASLLDFVRLFLQRFRLKSVKFRHTLIYRSPI